MSVQIKHWPWRFGNHLFQYAYARLLAEQNGLELIARFPRQDILIITTPKPGIRVKRPTKVLTLHTRYDLIPKGRYHYVIEGCAICAGNLYANHRESIKTFFQNPTDLLPGPGPDDLVVSLRLGEYAERKWVIHSDWYRGIIASEKYDKLYILGADPSDPYLAAFSDLSPIIVPMHFIENFHFIRRATKLICANSTYTWWAAFLGDAVKKYTFTQLHEAECSFLPGMIPIVGVLDPTYISATEYGTDANAANRYTRA